MTHSPFIHSYSFKGGDNVHPHVTLQFVHHVHEKLRTLGFQLTLRNHCTLVQYFSLLMKLFFPWQICHVFRQSSVISFVILCTVLVLRSAFVAMFVTQYNLSVQSNQNMQSKRKKYAVQNGKTCMQSNFWHSYSLTFEVRNKS